MFGEEAILVGLVAALSLDRSKVPTESAEEVKQRLKRVMGIEDQPNGVQERNRTNKFDPIFGEGYGQNTWKFDPEPETDPDCIEVEAHETDKPADTDFTNEN